MASFARGFAQGLPLGLGAARFGAAARLQREGQDREQRKQGLAILLKTQEIAAKGDTKGAKLIATQFGFPKLGLDPDDSFAKAFIGSLGGQAANTNAIADILRGADPNRPMVEQIAEIRKGDASPLLNMLGSTPPQGSVAIQTRAQPSTGGAPTALPAPGGVPALSGATQAPVAPQVTPQGAPAAPAASAALQGLQSKRDRFQAQVGRLQQLALESNPATRARIDEAVGSLNTQVAQADRQINQALAIGREGREARAEARGDLRTIEGQGLVRIRPGQAPTLLVPSLGARQRLQAETRELEALGDSATPAQKRSLEENQKLIAKRRQVVGRTESDLKVEAEARKRAAGSVDVLGTLGVVLRDAEDTPFALGFRGSTASVISGFLKQIPGMSMTAENVSQFVAGGSVAQVQKQRTDLISMIGKLIPTILNDTSGRYSDRDVALVKSAQGALKPTANVETLRGAIQALATAELMSRNRNLVEGGLAPDFDLTTDEGQRRLARVLKTMGFENEAAVSIRDDLFLVQRLGAAFNGER